MSLALASTVISAADVDQVTRVGEQRIEEGMAAQYQIENLSGQVGDIETEYKQVLKVVEGLKIYNGLLQRQVDNQTSETAALADSIDKVSLIERQVVPLMVEMLDSLDQEFPDAGQREQDEFPPNLSL
ncbi:MAG: DUF3450 family protein [Gammaproteobacteria bacterium]